VPVQKLPETAEAKAAVSQIYSALRVPIVDGEIPPGTRINIDAVARELGVSQTPVREALQRLDGDGLVVYSQGRGYWTTPMLDLQGLRSLFEFRLLVEPWAARSVATDRLANPSSALNKELETFEALADNEGDLRHDMLLHDARFHNIILAAVGNEVVRQAYAQTHCHLHVLRLYPVDFDGTITIAEHRKIWKAIQSCEPEEAERVMAEHVGSAFERSARAFDELNLQIAPLSRGESPRVRIVH
jgi:DNA-binding GntR family transcriptional regulator